MLSNDVFQRRRWAALIALKGEDVCKLMNLVSLYFIFLLLTVKCHISLKLEICKSVELSNGCMQMITLEKYENWSKAKHYEGSFKAMIFCFEVCSFSRALFLQTQT